MAGPMSREITWIHGASFATQASERFASIDKFASFPINPHGCPILHREKGSTSVFVILRPAGETVSGGGVVLDAKVPTFPGYQVPFAERVKRETGIVPGAVGLISDPRQAEEIVAAGKADFVSLARAMLI